MNRPNKPTMSHTEWLHKNKQRVFDKTPNRAMTLADVVSDKDDEIIYQSPPLKPATGQGMKFDDGKVPTDLFSIPAYLGVCEVLKFGAKKYAAWNWSKGLMFMRVYAATLRHLFAWATGEDNDKETGLSHIDHAMCELMFLSHFIKNPDKYKDLDDRPYGKVA